MPESRVRRVLAVVRAGPGDVTSLPEIEDDSWHELPAKSLVEVEDHGEAELQYGKCAIYVLQSSSMSLSSCEPEIRGNIVCLVKGMSARFTQCAGQVKIQSHSLEGESKATWWSLMYLPELELSLAMVSEGQVDVRPVLDSDGYQLGDTIPVTAENFMFTVPDAMLDKVGDIAGLKAREVYGFELLPAFIEDLGRRVDEPNLVPWMVKVGELAGKDGVLPPPPPVSTLPPVSAPAEEATEEVATEEAVIEEVITEEAVIEEVVTEEAVIEEVPTSTPVVQ
jgi:hypothetical protein